MSANNRHFLALIGQPAGSKGRATKYDPEAHCQLVRDLAEQGEFQEAWASTIGITVATMRDWVRQHEDFREAVVIAHQLLITYWTRKIADNVTSPDAKPGMFNILIKRFPAIYGRNAIDLQAWLMERESTAEPTPDALTTETAKAAPTDELQARLEALRRRRSEEQG